MLVLSFWLFVLRSVSCTQAPIRETANGQVQGLVKQSKSTRSDVEIFYGIPYAKPPVGNLRFENPEDPDDWAPTVRDATTFHARCYQYNSAQVFVDFHRPNTPGEDEDCLYLNIFVPTPITSTEKAVLVYIHGGGNVLGSAHMFDGTELASFSDIIVVTVNYRLGVLGFFGSGKADFPGNYALRDQIKALEWVKRNIANFGGDPSKVTLVGDNSAAWNVGRHLVSPLAAGLFRAVVSLGGSPTFKSSFKTDPQNEIQKMAKEMKCEVNELKECLKTKTALELSKSFAFHNKYLPYAVLADENFFEITNKADFNAQHYLLGYTADEPLSFITPRKGWSDILDFLKGYSLVRSDVNVTDIITFEYTDWRIPKDIDARTHSFSNCLSEALVKVSSVQAAAELVKAGLNVFVYEWAHSSPSLSHRLKSEYDHGIDLHHYLFGEPFSSHHYYIFKNIDKEMSSALMETMGNFVKDLNFAPNSKVGQESEWKYNNEETYLRFMKDNPDIQVDRRPVPRAVRFWEKYLPHISDRLRLARTK